MMYSIQKPLITAFICTSFHSNRRTRCGVMSRVHLLVAGVQAKHIMFWCSVQRSLCCLVCHIAHSIALDSSFHLRLLSSQSAHALRRYGTGYTCRLGTLSSNGVWRGGRRSPDHIYVIFHKCLFDCLCSERNLAGGPVVELVLWGEICGVEVCREIWLGGHVRWLWCEDWDVG